MENLKRRGLSLLLALLMIVSLFTGIQLPKASAAGTVDYVYSGNYVYNWGTRGELATYLSPMAETWWADKDSYATLSQLSGSSSTSSVSTSALYESLAALMTDAHTPMTTYDGTKELYRYTDCEESNTSKMRCFYTDTELTSSWDSASTWNREHTWPNSKSTSGSDSTTKRESDIMMLRATTVSSNSSRGNTPYGESSGYVNPNKWYTGTDTSFDVRGDAARHILYVYVRYGTDSTYNDGALNYMWGSSGVFESIAVMLKWMEADPVDTWELGRNDAAQSITGTRNVFVDYPELAFLLFDAEVPANYSTPSGEGAGTSYAITATSSNTAHGTVSINGRTITATPADGYYASGYTVTSGTATVTQNGNTFAVTASSDCNVQINFAAKTSVAVTFMENGTVGQTVNTYAGDAATFPSLTNAEPSGYTFLGWIDSSLQETTEKPGTIYAVGDSYTPTANTTYYALYTRSEGGSGDSQTITFDLGENAGAAHSDGSSATSKTWTSGSYTLEATNGTLFYVDAYDAQGNSAIKLGSSNNPGSFSFTVPDDVNSVIVSAAQYKANTTVLDINGTTYTLSTASNDGIYTDITIDTTTTKTVTVSTTSGGKRAMIDSISYVTGVAGTAYYTTQTCDHSSGNTTTVAQQDATCTTVGYTAGVQCNDCGGFISGHEVIPATNHPNTTTTTVDPTCTAAGSATVTCDDCGTTVSTTSIEATGHSYTSVVTPPTATEQGYTTHTCSTCGDSYVDSYTDALGETFTVSFSVPGGVTAIADMACNNTGITLPTPEGTPTGDYSYTFLGWVEATVNNTEIKPENIHKAGETFTATTNTTLYALYSYVIAGDGSSTDYVLTDLESISAADSVVITMTSADGATIYALSSANGSSSAPGEATVTSDGTKLTSGEPADDLKWNIVSTTDGYIIYVAGSTEKWLYCTDANNGVRVGTNTNNVFTITSGYLFNNATSRYVGVYTTNPDWRCYTSINSNIEGQTLGFYVKSTGTSYYTTQFCAHANKTNVDAKAATCTEAGYTAGVYCNDCKAYISGHETLAATGHDYEDVVTPPTATEQGYTTHTCANCSDSYIDSYVDALGDGYTVSFSVPSCVPSIDDIEGDSQGITLPTAEAPEGYTFLGWVDAKVDNATLEPTFYEKGSNFVGTGNITLHALYTYSIGSEGSEQITFEFGENVAAGAHKDTTSAIGTDVTFTSTDDAHTLTLDATAKVYKDCNDAAGNSALKFGSSSAAGSITFTVPDNVTKVIFKVAGYKSNTANISINGGTNQTITTLSDNGAYTTVEVDTSADKTVTFETVSGGYRAMVDSISYVVPAEGTTYFTTEICLHANTTTTTVAPTTTADGYETLICDDCGATVSYTVLPKLQFHAASLEVGEGISINFKVTADMFAEGMYDLDSVVATFTYIDHPEDTFIVTKPVLKNGFWVFQLKNVRPDWMGDTVSATISASFNGETVSGEVQAIEYSVAEYCYNKLNDTDSSDELKKLLIDMLDYGAATQLHTGYKTDALVTDNAAYTNNASLGTSSAPTLNAAPAFGTSLDNPAAAWKGAALFLRETVRIRLRFTAESIDGVTVTAQIGDNDPVVLDSFTSAGNNVYYVFFDNLLATQMREDVVFTVMQNGTAISNTLTYSVEAYATSATATAGTLADMLNAMMNYGDAVYAYAG